MTPREAINWLINLTADIGKSEHHDLWHYEQALDEIKEMLEGKDTDVPSIDTISRTDAIDAVAYAEDGKDAQRILEDLPSAQPSRIEQALHGKTPEEQYKILYRLMFEYANTFNDARRAVIDWLGE